MRDLLQPWLKKISQTQPRDLSNERSSSAMANMGGGGRGSAFSSQQPSRDSSLGRHDSRVSSHSYIPDLETQEKFGHQPGFESSRSYNQHQKPTSHKKNLVINLVLRAQEVIISTKN